MEFNVVASKAERQPKPKQKNKSQKLLGGNTPAITTDIVILQKPTTEFEYIAAPINAKGGVLLNLATVVKAKVIQEYGSKTLQLNLVAITDGARVIRHRLLPIFGVAVTIILDCYHCKKLRELISMIAANKLKKAKHLKFLRAQLWQGNSSIALEYLKHQVNARNLDKWHELSGELGKTSTENY